MGNVLINFFLFQPPNKEYKIEDDDLVYRNGRCRSDKIWLVHPYGSHAVSSIFIRARNYTKWTILYSHANAEDIASIKYYLLYLSQRFNINVLAYDYSGYGNSCGECSEENCYGDITAAVECLSGMGIPNEKVILFGRSLGTGPTCFMAGKMSLEGSPPAGVILHSAFTSIYRVVASVGCTLNGDQFVNIEYLKYFNKNIPILLIHGEYDNIVPFHHCIELKKGLSHVSFVDILSLKNTGHNHIDDDTLHIFMKKLQTFIIASMDKRHINSF